MRRQFLLGFLYCLISSAPLFASSSAEAETKLKDVVATVEQSYNSITDLQASFAQTTYLPSLKREHKGNGTLSIKKISKKPAMFRFDYAKPRQLIVSDGITVWFYLPENKQVMIFTLKSLFDEGRGVTLNYLTGIGRISRDFTISPLNGGRDAQGNYLLELIPKSQSRNLAKLQMTVSEKAVDVFLKKGTIRNTFPILSSVVFDQFGTKTTINFSNIKVNRGLSTSLFQFKAPSGVEVIRN